MALPTVADLKAYLRIEVNTENALLTALLARAKAMVELWVDCPIVGVEKTAYDPPGGTCVGSLDALVFPWRPIADEVTVTDASGTVIDAANYRVDRRSGIIYALNGYRFLNGPFAIEATVGLDQWDEYAGSVEALVSQVIIDVAADLYTRRTPMAVSETGAGTTIAWDASRECVERSRASLAILKLPVAL